MRLSLRFLRTLLLLALCAAVVVPGAAGATAAGPAAPGMVSVVHGVRGLVADVRVDGQLVLSGFAPQRVTDPLPLPAGSHRVQIWTAGSPASTRPALDTSVTVTAGSHVTLAVGLDAQGTPQITVYDDNLAAVGGGGTALAVRNIAATPPVRVSFDGRVVAEAILAPQQKVTAVAAGTHTVAVLPATSDSPLFPPQSVPTVAGRAMALYLIGSAKDRSLGWVAQPIRPVSAPTSVQTGVGALDRPVSRRGYVSGLVLAGLGMMGLIGWCVQTRRRRIADTACR